MAELVFPAGHSDINLYLLGISGDRSHQIVAVRVLRVKKLDFELCVRGNSRDDGNLNLLSCGHE